MKIDLTLDRICKICREDEFDHPCNVHLLYYIGFNGVEKIYDSYKNKDEIDEMMSLLIELHGISTVINEYQFRYSYEECKGRF